MISAGFFAENFFALGFFTLEAQKVSRPITRSLSHLTRAAQVMEVNLLSRSGHYFGNGRHGIRNR